MRARISSNTRPMRSGYTVASTTAKKRFLALSKSMAMRVTSPSVMPWKSMGEPTVRPRIDWSKRMRIGNGWSSGLALAAVSLSYSSKRVSALTGSPWRADTDSNATPPTASDTSDWVRTFRPLALTATSTPLAFQNRVESVTKRSLGASTKTSTLTTRPLSSSL
ncbi:Uncharacterised protein [Bordetella pertussis]|nr:Uncharacterised protein [Bordetella pertussis]